MFFVNKQIIRTKDILASKLQVTGIEREIIEYWKPEEKIGCQ